MVRSNFISTQLANPEGALLGWLRTHGREDKPIDGALKAAMDRHHVTPAWNQISIDLSTVANSLSVQQGSRGGFTTPEQQSAEWWTSSRAVSPMRRVATREVSEKPGDSYAKVLLDDGDTEGITIVENALVSDASTLTFGRHIFKFYTHCSGLVQVPNELLQDIGDSGRRQLLDALARMVSRYQNRLFTTGTGVSQPKGISVAAYSVVTAASATTITTDECAQVVAALDGRFLDVEEGSPDEPRWMCNATTWGLIQRNKDGQGAFIEPTRRRLCGYRVVLNRAMPDATTGQKPLVFGHLGSYMICDRGPEVSIAAYTELRADKDATCFNAILRSDGHLLDFGTDSSASKHPVLAITMA